MIQPGKYQPEQTPTVKGSETDIRGGENWDLPLLRRVLKRLSQGTSEGLGSNLLALKVAPMTQLEKNSKKHQPLSLLTQEDALHQDSCSRACLGFYLCTESETALPTQPLLTTALPRWFMDWHANPIKKFQQFLMPATFMCLLCSSFI